MRKMICSSIGVCFLAVSVGALAQSGEAMKQDTMKQGDQMKHNNVKAVSLSGMVSDDGKMLMSDSDHKDWMISNPEAVRGHEGHRVTVKASADAAKNEEPQTEVHWSLPPDHVRNRPNHDLAETHRHKKR